MSNREALDGLSLEEIEARLRDIDHDRAVLQRALQSKRQQTRKHVAQEVKDLIQARGHDLMDILDLITNKKRSNGRGHSYIHYVDPANPKHEYIRGVLPGWMKKMMIANGLNPNNKLDRKTFKELHLKKKIVDDAS